MGWSGVKEFFWPDRSKLLVFLLILLAYVLATFYQTFLLYSTAAAIDNSDLLEIERRLEECGSSCVDRSDLDNIRSENMNKNFLKPQVQHLISHYGVLQTIKTLLYPWGKVAYDTSISAPVFFDAEAEQNFDTGFYFDNRGGFYDRFIIIDFSLYYGPDFAIQTASLLAHLYLSACVIAYVSGRIRKTLVQT